MKKLLIGLIVALLLPALGGCDKIAELREKLPSGGDSEERTTGSEQEPGAQEGGEAMAKAMAEAMAEAMAKASSELSQEGSAEEAVEPGGKDVSEKPSELSLVDQARHLAEVRRKLEQDPSSMDEILAEAGIDENELEELIFRIAADPEAGAAYAGSL
ncbi:MAG: hypothetical protein ACOCVR_04295 [Myxococcota bacterium]